MLVEHVPCCSPTPEPFRFDAEPNQGMLDLLRPVCREPCRNSISLAVENSGLGQSLQMDPTMSPRLGGVTLLESCTMSDPAGSNRSSCYACFFPRVKCCRKHEADPYLRAWPG